MFKKQIEKKAIVRAIPFKNIQSKPRSFFDNLNTWIKMEGAGGLAYILFKKNYNGNIESLGPISKFFSEDSLKNLAKICDVGSGDGIFFICDKKNLAEKFSSLVRVKIANELKLIDENKFEFCWITDFPLYQYDEELKKIDFSHNPFSMPNAKINEFDKLNPLDVLAKQYDLVCNGIEISIDDPKGEVGEAFGSDDGALIREEIFNEDGINWVSFTYRCSGEFEEDEIVPKDDEIEEARWFSKTDALRVAVSIFDIEAISTID